MNEFSTLRVEVDGAIGRLTLAQPERLNPLGSKTLRELIDAAAWFDERDTAVVIVSGEGRAFSAGFDLHEVGQVLEEPTVGAELGARMAAAIEEMRAVTIASIHGHCIGGGVVLAAACGLRIAASGTRFSIPEVALGIPLGWGGVPRLVRTIGAAATRELVLTCREFDADEALRLGLLNRVVPADDLDDQVDALAAELAERPAELLEITDRQIALATAEPGANHPGTEHLVAALDSPRFREAARRFVEGR